MDSYENHLQFSFPGPYADSTLKFNTFAQEPTDIDNVVQYVELLGNGIDANVNADPVNVYVNQFTPNIDTAIFSSLPTPKPDSQTDYFTYMILDGQFVGFFQGNPALVPAPNVDTFKFLPRQPNYLEIQMTFSESTEVPFAVFAQIGNNDFTAITPDVDSFSTDTYRTFSFDQLPNGNLIDTATTYIVHVHVVNAHESSVSTSFEVAGIIGDVLDFRGLQLVSMGNLDTTGEISLSVNFDSDTTLSNVSYYVTAYSPEEDPATLLEMIQSGANVKSGLMGNGTNNVQINTDFQGNSFSENGNVLVQGLLVHGDTNKYAVLTTDVINMDVPVIIDSVFAAPVFKN